MTDASEISLSAETSKATIAKFGMAAIGFVGTIIFARILGNDGLGGYFLVFAAAELTVRPVAGIGEAVQKRAAEIDTPSGETFGVQLLFTSLWLLAVLLVALLISGWLNTYFSLDNGALLFALIIIGEGAYMLSIPMIQARGRIGLTTGIDALRSCATLALQMVFLLIGYRTSGLVYGLAIASLAVVPIALRYHIVRPKIPSRDVLAHIWDFSKYSTLNSLLNKTYERFDELLLGFLLTNAAVGNYGAAARLTLPALFIAGAASQGLMVRTSNLSSKKQSVSEDVANTLAFTSLLAIPMFFGSLVVANDLVVTVYGPEFAGAASLLVGLAFVRVVGSQTTALGRALDGLDRPYANTAVLMVALVFNITLGVVLTLEFGAIGVVLATAAAQTLTYLLVARAIRAELPNLSLVTRPFVEQLLAGVVMTIIVFAVKQVVPVQSWLSLGFVLTIGVFTYGITVITVSSQLQTTVRSAVDSIRNET